MIETLPFTVVPDAETHVHVLRLTETPGDATERAAQLGEAMRANYESTRGRLEPKRPAHRRGTRRSIAGSGSWNWDSRYLRTRAILSRT